MTAENDPRPLLQHFGALIQQLRVTGGLSPEAFSKRSGLPLETVEALERGQSEYSLLELLAIGRGLGMEVNRILWIWDRRDLASDPNRDDLH